MLTVMVLASGPLTRAMPCLVALPLAALAQPQAREGAAAGTSSVPIELTLDASLQWTDGGTVAVVAPPRGPREGGIPGIPLRLTVTLSLEQLERIVSAHRARTATQDARHRTSGADIQEDLRTLAAAVFKDGRCATGQSPAEEMRSERVLACTIGPFGYIRARREEPGCTVSKARLSDGARDMEVLLLEPAHDEGQATHQVLVVRTPPVHARVFHLRLLAADGSLCEHYREVKLVPGDAP